MAIDAWAHTPVMSRPGFEKLQDIMQQAGQLEERVAYDDLVNTEFAGTGDCGRSIKRSPAMKQSH